MARVSEWLVRLADLAEAEADAFRLAVRREAAFASQSFRRWLIGLALLLPGAVLLICAALLLVGSIYAAFDSLIGDAGAASLAAVAALILAGACLWGFTLATRT